jgi:hypothetical protein
MQWQTIAEAKAKDKVERNGCGETHSHPGGSRWSTTPARSQVKIPALRSTSELLYIDKKGDVYRLSSSGEKIYLYKLSPSATPKKRQ